MQLSNLYRSVGALSAGIAVAALSAPGGTVPGAFASHGAASTSPATRHVLLISVDGLHQLDVDRYVRSHPGSAMARLVTHGRDYTHASTTFPSDSFPGMVAQVTGGSPKSTGIYYDVSYNRSLLAPGTVDCATATPGTTVAFEESIDRDTSRLDAGQGLVGLPGSILSMTGTPQTLIDPSLLPVDPATCRPVYPSDYLKVNTIFEVAKQHGLRTAWSDKHPAYEILDGPSGTGVDDLFSPEINSTADTAGDDWTSVNRLTQQYDGYKVTAVENEIAGMDHSGTRPVGVPAIYGLNFQSVSTAEKLTTSDGLPGGYLADGRTPGPVLASALNFVNASIGRLERDLAVHHLADSTTLILSAKHGQSPTDPGALTRIDDGTILDQLNTAWRTAGHRSDLVAGSIDDDAMLLWLSHRGPAATTFAKRFLLNYTGDGTGNDGQAVATSVTGAARPYVRAGLSRVYSGTQAAQLIGVPHRDSRVPDLIGIVSHGTVYTGGTTKIAEHGGNDPQDRHVPLIVTGGGVGAGRTSAPVLTTQIAPTILHLLGLRPGALEAVRIEKTRVLPGMP
jgi:hypothetical protein